MQHKILMGTSKNPSRHAELVSESPRYQEIADQVRNDVSGKSVVFRSTLITNVYGFLCLVEVIMYIRSDGRIFSTVLIEKCSPFTVSMTGFNSTRISSIV